MYNNYNYYDKNYDYCNYNSNNGNIAAYQGGPNSIWTQMERNSSYSVRRSKFAIYDSRVISGEKRSLAVSRQVSMQDDINIQIRNALQAGDMLAKQGNSTEAQVAYKKGLALCGKENSVGKTLSLRLGDFCYEQKNVREAEQAYERALEYETILTDKELGKIYCRLLDVYISQKNIVKARVTASRAREYEYLLSNDERFTLRFRIGDYFFILGDYETARNEYCQANLVEDLSNTQKGEINIKLGVVYLTLKQLNNAKTNFELSLTFPEMNEELKAHAYYGLKAVYNILGDESKALVYGVLAQHFTRHFSDSNPLKAASKTFTTDVGNIFEILNQLNGLKSGDNSTFNKDVDFAIGVLRGVAAGALKGNWA